MRNGLGLSGVTVDDVIMSEAIQSVEKLIAEGGFHHVATANVDFMAHAAKDDEFREVLSMCDLVVADGMPIVWVSALFGTALRERVSGSDMVPELVRLSAERGYKIFLLGATPDVAEGAERKMRSLCPGVQVVGRYSPPIKPLDQFDNDEILAKIEAANPDILLVSFGSPKQEKWISRHRHKLKVPVCIGVGATLDFMAGSVKRAPLWMQKSGMEWVFRIFVEPQRLIPRYSADALWLARYLFVQMAVQRSFMYRQEPLNVTLDSVGAVNVVSVSGAITGSALVTLEKAVSSSILSGNPIVLDLASASHIGADGLWSLVGIRRRATQRNCELWLAGLSISLERQFRAAQFFTLFKSAPTAMDAIRSISRGRLQINVELGESWALCRISGDIPPGGRRTLEDICHCIRQSNEHFEFDASGMEEFDPGNLISVIRQPGKVVYVEAPRNRAANGSSTTPRSASPKAS